MEFDSQILKALEDFAEEISQDSFSIVNQWDHDSQKDDNISVQADVLEVEQQDKSKDVQAVDLNDCGQNKTEPLSGHQADDKSNSSNSGVDVKDTIEIPSLLEEYLNSVSKCGQILYPWQKVKPLFLSKLSNSMCQFHKNTPLDKVPDIPNCKMSTFKEIYQAIMVAACSFIQAPFTIQRLCELIVHPEKHYKRIDKFLRGLEKNITVVTTVDEKGNKISHDNEWEPDMSNGCDSCITSHSKSTNLTSMLGWFNTTQPGSPPLPVGGKVGEAKYSKEVHPTEGQSVQSSDDNSKLQTDCNDTENDISEEILDSDSTINKMQADTTSAIVEEIIAEQHEQEPSETTDKQQEESVNTSDSKRKFSEEEEECQTKRQKVDTDDESTQLQVDIVNVSTTAESSEVEDQQQGVDSTGTSLVIGQCIGDTSDNEKTIFKNEEPSSTSMSEETTIVNEGPSPQRHGEQSQEETTSSESSNESSSLSQEVKTCETDSDISAKEGESSTEKALAESTS